ncbi:MAG: UbiA family prenyltransferase [Saprospiraceae bacterium]|nr:UbiA family prenyltransferase [Saprospiraceae bacterium]
MLRHLWIGCCAVAMLLQTLLLLGRPWEAHGWHAGFLFGTTLCGYLFFRREPRLRILAWAAGLAALAGLWHLPAYTLLLLVAPGVVWMLYYFAGHRSLRRKRLLKPVSIAFVWAWMTVLLPLPPSEWWEVMLIFVGRAIFIFALALAYDLTDLQYDQRFQLPTLVRHLGVKKTFFWINCALVAAGLVSMINFFCEIYDAWAMYALIGSLACSAGLLRIIQSELKQPWLQKFWIDGLMIFQFLCVWIADGLSG